MSSPEDALLTSAYAVDRTQVYTLDPNKYPVEVIDYYEGIVDAFVATANDYRATVQSSNALEERLLARTAFFAATTEFNNAVKTVRLYNSARAQCLDELYEDDTVKRFLAVTWAQQHGVKALTKAGNAKKRQPQMPKDTELKDAIKTVVDVGRFNALEKHGLLEPLRRDVYATLKAP